MTPKKLALLLNLFGPYFGAGVRVDEISSDWRYCRVSMKLRWFNTNAVKTHFGGSLYSMVDPHYMLMLMNILGKEYTVWDKSAEIDFVRPGKGRVWAEFTISEQMLDDIYRHTASGEKYLPEMLVEVLDENKDIVCRVKKTLYIRKKPNKNARF